MPLIASLVLLSTLAENLRAVVVGERASPLFDQVQLTTSQNLGESLDALFGLDRACLLFPLGDDYQNERRGANDSTDRTTEVMLQIVSRDFSITAGQMLGVGPNEPGILELKDLVLERILGSDLGYPRAVKILPGPGSLMQLEKEEDGDLVQSRQCWSQILRIRAGGTII